MLDIKSYDFIGGQVIKFRVFAAFTHTIVILYNFGHC